MLAILIQRYDKKILSFQERGTNRNFTGVRCHIYCTNTIYQFIQPFLDNKMSVFAEYGAINGDAKNKTRVYAEMKKKIHRGLSARL